MAKKAETVERFEGFADAKGRFFKQLAKNQTREWFTAHKHEFEQGWHRPMELLLAEVREKIDATFEHCDLGEPKIFRIYRDVRFSKDKSPYKTHIGGLVPVAGDGGAMELPAAVYVQLGEEPVMAAGHYMIPPDQLAKYRAAVLDDARGKELAAILAKLAKKGYELGSHEVMARVPKGLDPAHPREELLRRKGIVVTFPAFDEELVTSRAFVDWIVKHAKPVAPLVEWLTYAVA